MKSHVGWGSSLVVVILLGSIVWFPHAASLGQEPAARTGRGDQVFVAQGCYGCHQIGKFGTPIGPDLSRLGGKHRAPYLRRWLRDPESVRPTAHMPKLELSVEEIEALATYLASLE